MLLTIDIGNSNIVFGVFEEEKLIQKWRLISDKKKSIDDYAIDIIELFLTAKINVENLSGCIIASVVPDLSDKIKNAIAKFFHGKILTPSQENLDIEIELKNKSEIGHDRLINAIAAYEKFGGNLVIVDFGTATTFDIVGEFGQYLGGVISPGVNLSIKALHDMTAKLPQINIAKTDEIIGKNTTHAMQAGVYFGYVYLVQGILQKIDQELGKKTTKIITGGLAELFQADLEIKHFEPELTLNGLLSVYKKLK